MNPSSSTVALFGRIFLSAIFLISGFFKLAAYSQMVAYAGAKGLPLASVAMACAIAIEILGGLAVVAGFQARIVAWVLFLYLIPVTYFFHSFWAMQGMERQDNMIHFLKNLSIMGGTLLLAANGPGAHSVDAKLGKAI